MTWLFWGCLLLLVYIYIGYPVALELLSRRVHASPRTPTPLAQSPTHLVQPRVSVLIAAYNEEALIGATIRNKLECGYPVDRLEILVASDGSTDGTDAEIAALGERLREEGHPVPLRCLRQEPRQGKTAAINRLAAMASGEILVVSDANSLYEFEALARLVAPFADPRVGYVTGRMVYANPDGSLIGDGCTAYMRYENWLRVRESRLGGIIGVDGGIDAMRRDLFESLRADQLPDFVQPLKVAEKGFAVVFEPAAVVRETAHQDARHEWAMRVRVALRAMHALRDMQHLLDPRRDAMLAFKLWSHKLLRYHAFMPLGGLALSSLWLAPTAGPYALALLVQVGFYALAYLGFRHEAQVRRSALLGVPYYFTLLNLACAQAFWRFLRGRKVTMWQPRQG